MSDDEVESFEITDYDLENEFNINRKQFRQTKNQSIYGIWAQPEDEDSGDEGPSSRPSFKKGGSKKSYTAPVSFVAGGIQQAGKPKKEAAKNEEEDEEDEEEEDERRPSRRFNKNRNSSSDEDSRPSSMKAPSFAGLFGSGDIAGLRKKSRQFDDTLAKKGVGNWEKHTKGIGAKLLLQMGYQPGRGLGKDLQGIQAPIEAHLRKGRGAIGAYGPEKAKKKELEKEQAAVKEGGSGGDASLSQWRKDGGGGAVKKKSVQYVYKSIEDVLEESKYPSKGKREFSELAKVKVIDMTGPEQRVLSGYHAISGVKKPSEQWELRREKKFTNFELPELQHNLDLLVEMCEEAIVQNNKQRTYTDDRSVTLENELKNLEKVEAQEAQSIATLEKVLAIVEGLMEKSENNTLTLDLAADAFQDLQTNYLSEYCTYEVQALALGVVLPLFKDQLCAWPVLQAPHAPVDAFRRWKALLHATDASMQFGGVASTDPYQRLIWDAWMPCVRIAVSTWNCRDYGKMLELLEIWRGLIPGWTMDSIINELIVPKLQREVDEWNPVTDTIPIHTWIHPWLPLIGVKALETSVFPTIRHKLSVALVNWHPSDPSARLMLTPWQGVFNKGQLDAFIINNIVPKLHVALQQLVINPHQQHLDNWKWVMDWSEMVPVYSMASILDKSFFRKWMQVLSLWLNVAQPNYDQVSNWYQGWKAMIPQRLLTEPSVQEHLNTALTMMSRSAMAVTGGGEPSAPSMLLPTASAATTTAYQKAAECTRTSNQVPHGFKDLVEKKCEEMGILWAPMPNRYREAKQIYKCGNLQCYIDRNVIFVCDANTGMWTPVSLQQLLDKAVK
ncbi:hypothetical protein LSTR_LSTR004474 [Laodelphax striatellus]|uniref:G-patch domain-containing protein n=1 Tax=Laodelphax striatellus TaxID=195883 RepID=A0A482XEK3_LAOST|nr:hypothetical protein LSTR_LSTR004474 [Laodelphax striatellus]